MVIGVDSSTEPGVDVQASLVGAADVQRSSRPGWRRRIPSGAYWSLILGAILGLLVLASDLANPIRTCPSWVVSDGGLPFGPGPADFELSRTLPADEVPDYEVSVQLVPPLVRCRPPNGPGWPPPESGGPSSGRTTIDRWTGASVIGLAALQTAAATALILEVRRRRQAARNRRFAHLHGSPGARPTTPDDPGESHLRQVFRAMQSPRRR